MLKGEAYLYSSTKRSVDRNFAYLTRIPEQYALSRAATFVPADLSVIFNQERIGQAGNLITVSKIQTLDPATQMPFSDLAEKFRRIGLDEITQRHNVLDGTMSMVGRRPLLPSEHVQQYEIVGHDYEGAKLVDRHKTLVIPTLPGFLGSHIIEAHRGDNGWKDPAHRLELDLKDCIDASLRLDLMLLQWSGSSILKGRMRIGRVAVV